MNHVSSLEEYLEYFFQLSERKAAFQSKKFKTLELELINSCNLHCSYCYPESSQNSKDRISFKKSQEIIDIASKQNISEIVLIGGEPLLHPKWYEISSYAKNAHLRTELYTNGTLLHDNAQKIIESIDWLRLHFDSIESESFFQTQRPSNAKIHEIILKGVDSLLDLGFESKNIELVIPLTKTSYSTLEDTITFAKDRWGIELTTLVSLVDFGAAKKIPFEKKLTSKEYEKAFQIRANLEQRPWLMKLGTSEYPKEYQTTTFMITVLGDVIPYPALPLVCGNIYEKDLSEIIQESYSVLAFRNLLNFDGTKNLLQGDCGSCSNMEYCFGTRSMAFNNGKGLSYSDPTCWYVDEVPHKISSLIQVTYPTQK